MESSTASQATVFPPRFGSPSDIYETADPVCIGSGSFATIYVTKGNPIAFKVVHYESDSEALLEEFGALRELYQKCASSPGFLVPGPKGFYDPAMMMVVFHSGQSVPLMTASPEAIAARPIPTLFDGVYSKHGRAMYAMTRVHRFPVDMAHILSEKYIPSSFSVKDPPFLLRLYFGKQLKITRFTNTRNFPVDIERYEYLRDTAQATLPGSPPLPPVLELVGYMGQTLGKIHFYAGYDARDVEFICGGDGWSEACFYVIDFNQVNNCPFLCM